MKKLIKMTIALACILMIASCSSDGDGDKCIDCNGNDPTIQQMKDRFSSQVLGETKLTRSDNKITVSGETRNLKVGHVYKLVVVTVDQPENCNSKPCSHNDVNGNEQSTKPIYFVVDSFVATSTAYSFDKDVLEKDVTTYPLILGYYNDNYGGLQDAQKAEVHVYLRSQGPEIGGMLETQMGDYLGGCTMNYSFTDPNARVPIDEGECAWIQESFHTK